MFPGLRAVLPARPTRQTINFVCPRKNGVICGYGKFLDMRGGVGLVDGESLHSEVNWRTKQPLAGKLR